MRKMKDSGIEWIGEIPENWKIYKLKYLFQDGDGALKIGPFGSAIRGKTLENGPYKIYNQAHLIKGDFSLNRHFVSEETFAELSSYEVKAGDILFSMMGTIGKCRLMPDGFPKGIMDSHLLKARLNDIVDSKFFCYVYDKDNSPVVINQLEYMSNGSIMAGLNSTIVKSVIIPVPPLSEQTSIVAHLDTQCAHIDSVIEKTKQSIEEYKKLKQAVITQAVTKGVRGEREMKDSGVEWIGQIPSDWKTSRVGLHFDIILGKMLCPNQISDDYTLESYFCAANVHFDGISQDNIKQMWFSSDEKKQYKVNKGDLLVVEGGAGAGGSAIVKEISGDFYIQNSIMIVRSKGKYSNYYLRYLIEYLVKSGYVDLVCNKATIPHFTKDKLANVPFILNEEQSEIAAYLDQKCAEIDTLITKKEQFLTELESYKKSMIYEYVTGKKEVEP